MAKLTKRPYLNKTFKFKYAITYVPNAKSSKKFTKTDIQNEFEQELLRILKKHDKNAKIIINKVVNNDLTDRKDRAHFGTVHYHIIILTNKRIDSKNINPDGMFNLKDYTFHIQNMYYAKGWLGYINKKHHILKITHNFEKIQYIKIYPKSLKSMIAAEIIQNLMHFCFKSYKTADKKAKIFMFKSFGAHKYAVF